MYVRKNQTKKHNSVYTQPSYRYLLYTHLLTHYICEYIQYMITIYIYIAIILSGNNMQLLLCIFVSLSGWERFFSRVIYNPHPHDKTYSIYVVWLLAPPFPYPYRLDKTLYSLVTVYNNYVCIITSFIYLVLQVNIYYYGATLLREVV